MSDEDPRFTEWWNRQFDPDETGRGRMLAHHGFLAGLYRSENTETLTVSREEYEQLKQIKQAAKRFDQAGATVHQMGPAQWDAYIQLKALFHGGIEGEDGSSDGAFRRRVIETVVDDLKANGPIRMALLGL
jgi:hypothetical protein